MKMLAYEILYEYLKLLAAMGFMKSVEKQHSLRRPRDIHLKDCLRQLRELLRKQV